MFTYIITGSIGHLGSSIIRLLEGEGCEVRGLVLPSETAADHLNVRYFYGDVTMPETLTQLFEGIDPAQTILIHTAGLIDIGEKPFDLLHAVNVRGTENVLTLCKSRGIKRMVYVSSVHAIPESADGSIVREADHFSPDEVIGNYAKTKAEATQKVLEASKTGLDAVIVHPSGILGPYDNATNHLVQVIRDYMQGRLPAGIRGGYDLVDVRDVAEGCLAAATHGRSGECYILSNRYYEVKELLDTVRVLAGGRRIPMLPIWLASLFAPLFTLIAKLSKGRPLYTRYSLHALSRHDQFSHEKATEYLQYTPRDLTQTVTDTIAWLRTEGIYQKKRKRKTGVSEV